MRRLGPLVLLELGVVACLYGASCEEVREARCFGECVSGRVIAEDGQADFASVELLQRYSGVTSGSRRAHGGIDRGPLADSPINADEEFLGAVISDIHSPTIAGAIVGSLAVAAVWAVTVTCTARWAQNKDDLNLARYHHACHRLTILLLVLLGVLVLAVLLEYFVGWLVAKWMEQYSFGFLGVQVSLERLGVNPFKGSVVGRGLTIGNPPGYQSDHMATAKSVYLKVGLWRILTSMAHRIPLEEILVRGVDVIYEQGLTGSNILDLVHKLDSGDPSGSSTKIIVGKVDLQDIQAHVAVKFLRTQGPQLNITDIKYDDFNREVGATVADDIVKTLLVSLLKSVLAAVAT